ncbi:MAG: ABC transporter permease [Anaerolineales bacterium]|nr:ABC transporter permease [Anaerolineales bacterium]MCX7753800.1 ABC transporter permease [Anaerolineales bacterium]MDW8276396.1 ABC transporter permease [Anaerolineales bacterium]
MDTSQLLSATVLVGILTAGIRLASPYLFAAIGEMFGQRSGVLNLGVEGQMLMGAFTAFYVTLRTGNPWLGLLAAMAVGALMGLAMAVVSVTWRAVQGISGIGFYIVGMGLSELLFKTLLGEVKVINTGFNAVNIPLLSQIPVLGEIFFRQNVMTYLAFTLVPVAWFVLYKTPLGLKIRAVGENPHAADTLGVNVAHIRYLTVTMGGVFSAMAGAALSVANLNVFQENMTAGMGFIAVALVYFGGWRPFGVLFGALLFSMVMALQIFMQVYRVPVPSEFLIMMPYVLTMIVLVLTVGRVRAPAALTKPFVRE